MTFPMYRNVVKWLLALVVAAGTAAFGEPFPVTVTVDAAKPLREVPPLLFGQNIEWTGNGDGFWDPTTGKPRTDALALLKPLEPALIRFPGGSLSNSYRWADAIGPVQQRRAENTWFSAKASVVDGHWTLEGGRLQAPVYGFDEHMRFISDTGAAGALVTVNATQFPGSPQWGGSAQEAAAWVAYANSTADGPDVSIGKDDRGTDWHTSRYWAQQRAANGHPAPYGVRYWEIGNEVDLGGQGAGLTGPAYAARVVEYARAMRAVDPSIQIGAVLGFKWLQPLLQTAGTQLDFLIYHFYAPGSGDVGLTLWSNGEKTAAVDWPGGNGTVTVRAYGTPAAGVWPEMVVKIDDREIARQTVDHARDKSGDYRFPVNLPAGPHRLSIGFTNDLQTATEDRNLFIEQVSIAADGHRSQVHWITPEEMSAKLASEPGAFAAKFDTIRQAVSRWAPTRADHICVFVTEFNAMYNLRGPDADQIKALKSALMVDGILQKALAEPLCEETNFWCLGSWYFRIVELDAKSAYLSPSGCVYSLFTPLHRGSVLTTSVDTPSFPQPAAPEASAVAVGNGRQIAVNIVNFDPARSATVRINVPGRKLQSATARVLTGPSPEAMNTPAAPRTVYTQDAAVTVSGSSASLTMPPHSAATVEMSE